MACPTIVHLFPERQSIFPTCLALRRAQRIEREASEDEGVRAGCAQECDFLLYKGSEHNDQLQERSP